MHLLKERILFTSDWKFFFRLSKNPIVKFLLSCHAFVKQKDDLRTRYPRSGYIFSACTAKCHAFVKQKDDIYPFKSYHLPRCYVNNIPAVRREAGGERMQSLGMRENDIRLYTKILALCFELFYNLSVWFFPRGQILRNPAVMDTHLSE